MKSQAGSPAFWPSFSGAGLSLVCHPARPAPAAMALEARVGHGPEGGLSVAYRLLGEAASVRLPAPAAGFADGLWQHTCFELFAAIPGNPAYREFNFSPSGQWAAYGFADYRQPDPDFRPAAAPALAVRRLAEGLELAAHLPAALLPAPGAALQLGLSAVVEGMDGRLGYWALAHSGPQPDFHRRDAFILELAVSGSGPCASMPAR